MPLWKSILTYDGTSFHGWQVQPGLTTVQGTLAHALLHITGENVLPQGSGRTDAGVHALAQVASFSLDAPIPPSNLLRALNRVLPRSLRVLSVQYAPPGFHARHSALSKTYEYRIYPVPPTGICSPMLAPFVWDCHLSLDFDRLQQAASHVLGTHDFASFAASSPDLTTRTAAELTSTSIPTELAASQRNLVSTEVSRLTGATTAAEKPAPHSPEPAPSTIRTIFHSSWRREGDLLLYRVNGSGFLHHMVRNLVGTFVDAAAGRLDPGSIPAILSSRNRSAAGPTAPARGLFLVEVTYP